LRYLAQVAPPNTITPLLFEDTEQHIIGMAAVPRGHRKWKEMLLSEGPVRQHVLQFAEILASIHKESSRARERFEQVFRDQSVFESLRLEPYYLYSSSQVEESQQFFFRLLSDTRRIRIALVHGDYSPKNILVYNGRLILIDHEVVHFGDPAFDIGFSLTHLLSKANHCREQRAAFLESAKLYIERYLECAQTAYFDSAFESRACRHALGCLLARVAGRSPLEYLGQSQRAAQQRTVLHLMERPPVRLSELVYRFGKELCASN
jgi:aminoglycoside phosphotransferase (APT) family kinase protein